MNMEQNKDAEKKVVRGAIVQFFIAALAGLIVSIFTKSWILAGCCLIAMSWCLDWRAIRIKEFKQTPAKEREPNGDLDGTLPTAPQTTAMKRSSFFQNTPR